jgi:hypothetical protein
VAILQGKTTEESSVRTIESKGFLRSSPLPRYRASAPITLALQPEKIHLRRAGSEQINLERETGFEPATSTLARSHSTTELLPLVLSFYSTCAFRDNSLHPPLLPFFLIPLFPVARRAPVRQEALE